MPEVIRNTLSGRTALVVGSSPNIGSGVAIELARAGAAVGCVDRDPRFATLAAKEIVDTGGQSLAVECDATDPAAVERAFASVEDAFGPVDLLVNGVVVYAVQGLLEMPFERWRMQLSVMLDSAFLFTSTLAKRLVATGRGGAVVNVISTAGHQGEPGNIGYTTAKGGLLNMTRSAAVELAPHGIRVNSVTPTATDPAEWADRARRWDVSGPDEAMHTSLGLAAQQVPLGRLPRPADYGRAIAFLLSDDARMITGTDLAVDSGSLARYWRTKPVGGP